MLDFIFNFSGVMMTLHIVLSYLLRFLIRGNSKLDAILYIEPNRLLGTPHVFRMIRAKYFLLWKSTPDELLSESITAQIVFMFARLAGVLFLVLLLIFFVYSSYLAAQL